MNEVTQKLMGCYESIKDKIPFQPRVGLVLGSGLGDYGDRVQVEGIIEYGDISGFPVSTAPGHKGRFIFCHIGDTPVVLMQGRVHYYEGYPMSDVVLPIRLMAKMGIKTLFLTNAAGGINYAFKAGDLMLITDQITLFVPSPLIGPNDPELGVRFPDMSSIYTPRLRDLVKTKAYENSIFIKEGVYFQDCGPQYETPADIRAIRLLGGDVVGMSTGVEAIAARHMGLEVVGISCVSNLAAGISPHPLSEEEVLEAGRAVSEKFSKLVTEVIKSI